MNKMIRPIITGIAVVIGVYLIAYAIGGMRWALAVGGGAMIVIAMAVSVEIGKRGK